MRTLAPALLCALCCASQAAPFSAGEPRRRTVVDSLGRVVGVVGDPRRIVTISDGLIEGVMTALGMQDRIVGLGSDCLRSSFDYVFPLGGEEASRYRQGVNPVTFLNPRFRGLPLIAGDTGINYEALVALQPDLVLLRLGSCTFQADDEKARLATRALEALGFPLVILKASHLLAEPDVSSLSEEIRIIGESLGRPSPAEALSRFLADRVREIGERLPVLPVDQRPRVLILGLSPSARERGGAGVVFGAGTLENHLIETVLHARNAYPHRGYFRIVSTEHLLAIDPDVIVLCTATGYHPPEELYRAPYYRHLRLLGAVRQRRVSALPFTPCNCAKRLEYPIDVMVLARAAYPDRFRDFDPGEWLVSFYRGVYGVDRATAVQLRSAQWLDWLSEGEVP